MNLHQSQKQQSAGQHANQSAHNDVLSKAMGLNRLVDYLNPQPGWRVLDIANRGDHTALAMAAKGADVIASHRTLSMVQVARQTHHQQQDAASSFMHYLQHDAENLPFDDAIFDGVTCSVAAHHFPNVQRFVEECVRVLKPGGRLGIVDIIVPAEPRPARYCNTLETLRDPSHVQAYSLVDWDLFLTLPGLVVEVVESIELPQQAGIRARQAGCDEATLHRLRAMLIQAPPAVREWYQIDASAGWSGLADIPLTIPMALMIGRKPI